MKNLRKSLLKTLLVLAAIVSMVLAGTVSVQAATKITAATKDSKAPKVSVNKTYIVSSKTKKDYTYVAFKVPKTATYKFNFSKLARYGYSSASKKSEILGHICFMTKKGKNLQRLTLSKSGKKDSVFRLQSEYWTKKYYTDKTYPKSFTASAKLKKGTVVYMRSYFLNLPFSYSLKITKK